MASDVVVTDSPADLDDAVTTPAGPAKGPPRWVRRVGIQLGAIAVFTLPAVVLWWHAWSGGPSSTVRCSCLDSGQQVWFVAWPAYALAHGLSPFSTTWLWPPHGVNLLDNASFPLVGIVLAPVTWIFGPFTATTLALTLAPGLSAWGCWLACRRFVRWEPACWVGGFAFGYSPFIVGSVASGHLSIGLMVLPPLMLVLLHEILVRQARPPLWCGVGLGALIFGQFLISAEVLTMIVPVAVIGIVVAAAISPRQAWGALPYALRAFAATAVTALVLLAFPVAYLAAGPQHIHGSIWSGLQDFFVSRAYQLWSPGPYAVPFFGLPGGPPVAFVGFGMIIVALGAVVVAWRRKAMWVMATVAVATTVLSWGAFYWPSPDHFIYSRWLPWYWLTNRPLFNNLIAGRFAIFADLAAAVVVAIGLDALRRWTPWRRVPRAGWAVVVVGVAALVLVPMWVTYEAPLVVSSPGLPQWYSTAALNVPEGSVVTSYPFPASATLGSQPMVWQAADGMRFRLAGGYVKVPGPDKGTIGSGLPGSGLQTMVHLTIPPDSFNGTFPLSAYQLGQLRSSLGDWQTSYIVVVDSGSAPVQAAAALTAATGRLPQISHRAWVWDLRSRPLRPPYDAASASRAFETCRSHFTGRLGPTPAGQPLPQAFNRCVVASSHPG